MTIAVIFVHYHTEELLVQAIKAILASNWPVATEFEIIVVNNGSDRELCSLMPKCSYKIISSQTNLGYAGGINLGVSHTDAEILCLTNPDVIVNKNCLPTLVRVATENSAIVGPRLFLDEGQSLILPCTEVHTRMAELIRTMATLHPTILKFARRNWRQHVRRYWLARSAVPCYSLSGALLVVSRSVWDKIGPFDNGFQLYYEESDWLLRAEKAGVAALYVPAAIAVHRYNQSAVQQDCAIEWMNESAHKFSVRYYGRIFTYLMGRLRSVTSTPGIPQATGNRPPEINLSGIDKKLFPIWMELTAYPNGYPGGAVRIDDTEALKWKMPDDVWRYLTPAPYIVQIVDAAGVEIKRTIMIR